jgi:hypothetical protein
MTKVHLTSKIALKEENCTTKSLAATTAGSYYYSLKTANTTKTGKVVISK